MIKDAQPEVPAKVVRRISPPFSPNAAMKILLIITSMMMVVTFSCSAFSARPFKVSQITLDFELGRKAIFTLETFAAPASGKKHNEKPQVVAIQFVFENGSTAMVPKEGLAGIALTDLHLATIETGFGKGTWFLKSRIENTEEIPNRSADDWVIFAFEGFKYKDRRIERNEKSDSMINLEEFEILDLEPATPDESKSDGGNKPQP